ncbi:MAG: hypothetical protein HOI49_01360 [Bacteroidetes bacterium]|nr:hypothetical protein [Bacteroidota bacterium]MDA8930086.1 hypothetical protein [Bacteroidia bacterium]
MFKYIIIGLVVYWLYKRTFSSAKRPNRQQPGGIPRPSQPNKQSTVDHSKGGEYVDYEEVE